MGVVLFADEAVRFVLLILLIPVLALTVWETRERGFERKSTQWWFTFVLLTHAFGYVALRIYGAYQDRSNR